MSRIYLDHNATAPLRPEARAAMIEAMDVVGNPSSVHAEGRAAKALIERARAQVAALVGCEPSEVVFTSGATEANNTVFSNSTNSVGRFGEHESSNAAAGHWCCVDQGVESFGDWSFDWQQAEKIVSTSEGWVTDIASFELANGETGCVVDVARAFDKLRHSSVVNTQDKPEDWSKLAAYDNKWRFWCHSDATQAVGKIAVSYGELNAHLLSLSAHKLGGPKGIGCLVIQTNLNIEPICHGGGQEMGRRSGTENVIGIAGFGAAAAAAKRDLEAGAWGRVEELRNILEKRLADVSGSTIFVGKDVARLPNTSCFITPGWKGETQVMQMDLAGFAISAGSACSSGKVSESRVLRAMGYSSEEARSAVRVSLGLETTEDEVLRFCDAWARAYDKHAARAASARG